jgi:hypothetical protein
MAMLRDLARVLGSEMDGEEVVFDLSVDGRQVGRLRAWAAAEGLTLVRG